MEFFTRLFDTSDFPPRWHCGHWSPGHGWLHILSDLGVWSAYLAIPCVLGFFVLRKKDVPFRNLFWLFGAFILACGTTHLMEAIIFWWPAYRLAGVIKLFTAVVSWATIVALVPIVPRALAMRTPEELEREIAERRRTEEALRLASARLDLGLRGSNIGIWEIDLPGGSFGNGRVDFLNVLEQLGYCEAEVPADFAGRLSLVHPEDRPKVERALQAYLSGETRELEVEHRARHKDGSYRWMLTRGVAMRDGAGRPVRLIGSSIDITDHRRAEQALRESEERFRGTFENAAVGIAHKGPDGRFLRVNEKYCEIVRFPRAELLSRSFQDITHPEDVGPELEQYRQLMDGKLPSYSREKRYLRKDRSLVWIDLSVSLQRDAGGRPTYAIAVLQDISERKRLERELRQAKEAAEGANRAKDEFLANVSHEIRTPMNAILGMTELALDTPLTDDQREYLTTVKSAGDNLLGIINDLLDFSKIEAGKLELDAADFSLRASLRDTMRALAVRAHTKGLELVCQVQPDVPDALVGDAGRLRQVLLNLIGNAIKFTEHGEVIVHVQSERRNAKPQIPRTETGKPAASDLGPSDLGFVSDFEFRVSDLSSEVLLRFEVRDTGIGIPRDKQQTIFRAFEQEDTSTTRRYGGTGLGLTIAARLVAMMGGTIAVESEPGRGSTFTFTARLGRQPHRDEPLTAAEPPVSLRGLPVLIVDDNAANRRILQEWLRGWQMHALAVGDAAAAMDALWHGYASGRPYALALLDSHMPGTDGLTLAAQIRQRAELSDTHLILLTSGVRLGSPERIRELHLDAHLLKPVQQDELLATIARVLGRADSDAPAAGKPAEAPAPTAAPLRVLVAEDNEFNARHLERLLGRGGHRVQVANNGRAALELLQIEEGPAAVPGPPSPGSFDVLLLDLHMPELDGFQVVRAVREWERTVGGHLPVIALTARSREEDRERCLAAGMDDYLAKPIRTAELFAAIDRALSAHGACPPVPPPAGDRTGLLDPGALLAACGDDAEGLRALCQDFQTYAPGRLAEVSTSLRDGDAPRLREAAHKLCGLLSAFSTVAGDLASELEDHAASALLEEVGPLVARLERMVGELIREVNGVSLERLKRQPGTAAAPGRAGGA